jgi:hypothetical protein
MNNVPISPFLNASFLINLIICLASLYSAWINLSKKQISKFGFDAFILFIGQLIDKNQAAKIRDDQKLIRRMGIMMILFGIGALYAMMDL